MPRFDGPGPDYIPLRQQHDFMGNVLQSNCARKSNVRRVQKAVRGVRSHGNGDLSVIDQLPVEVSIAEAAHVLDCDPNTVRKMIRHGMLRARNTSGKWASRARYAIELASVLDIRCTYRTTGAVTHKQRLSPRRSRHCSSTSDYIQLD